MIITNEKTNTIVDNSLQTNKVTAKLENLKLVIKALTTNLYSDPIGSVVREYFSNCVDAITRVNSQEKILIEWVTGNAITGISSSIKFIDKGSGLTKEEMERIYLSLGESDKRDNENEIGGFGFGSKSFVSYADSMTVTSIKNGRICSFFIYKDQEGDLAYTCLLDEEHEGQNGTTVEIPTKSGDRDKFFAAIEKQLCFFNNFEIRGFSREIEPLEIVDEDVNYCIVKNCNREIILLGKIAYSFPRELDAFDGLVVKFNIGELQPTPSRESIKFDSVALNKIKAKLLAIRETLLVKAEKARTESATSYMNVIGLNYNNKIGQYNINALRFIYNNNKIPNVNYVSKYDPSVVFTKLGSSIKDDFNGFTIQKVCRKQSSRRRRFSSKSSSSASPDYTIEKVDYYHEFFNQDLPVYAISSESRLNAKTNLFMFQTSEFFIIKPMSGDVVNYDNLEKKELARIWEVSEYYDSLPKYEDVKIPETVTIVTDYEAKKEEIKERKQQRKANGLFPYKHLGLANNNTYSYGDNGAFCRQEGNYEHIKSDLYYFSSEEEAEAVKLYVYLRAMKELKWRNSEDIKFIKVSKEVFRELEGREHCYHYSKIMKLETPLNAYLANFATVKKITEEQEQMIEKFSDSDFSKVNSKIRGTCVTINSFLCNNQIYAERWFREEFVKEVLDLCDKVGNYNHDILNKVKEVEEYFQGAELLRFVDVDKKSVPFITNYLLEKGKEVDLVEISECVSA